MFAGFCKISMKSYETSMKFYGTSTRFYQKNMAGYKPYHYHGTGLFTFGSTRTAAAKPPTVDATTTGRNRSLAPD